jgi:hypothetical protein
MRKLNPGPLRHLLADHVVWPNYAICVKARSSCCLRKIDSDDIIFPFNHAR